jgi:hypothetical protein
MRGKMTPTAGSAFDLVAGQRYFDRKPFGVEDAALEVIMPLSLKDVGKNLKRDEVSVQAINFLLSFEGIKVSDKRDFAKEKKSGRPSAPEAPEAPKAPE